MTIPKELLQSQENRNGFPEPVADFVYNDPESRKKVQKRLTLGELKQKITETSLNLRQAWNLRQAQRDFGPIPERKHGGRLVSKREKRDIRKARRRGDAEISKGDIKKLKERLEVLERKKNTIFFGDSSHAVIIEMENGGEPKIKGESLPPEEAAWRRFLDETGFRSLWSQPQISVVKQAFILRQAVNEARLSSDRNAETSAKERFAEFLSNAPDIPLALHPLMKKIGERFPVT